MQGAIFERKYELDSLMSVLKLARLCAAFASTCTRPSARSCAPVLYCTGA